MFKKLRIQMILIELGAFLFVTLLIVGSINLNAHYQVVKSANIVLDVLKENNGQFPKLKDVLNSDNMDEEMDFGFGTKMTNETRYTTRYFSVVVDREGNIIEQNMDHIASVSNDKVVQYVQQVLNKNKPKSSVGKYRYLMDKHDGVITIYFVDCYNQIKYVRYMIQISSAVAAICMVIITIFVYIFSGKAIKPMEINMQRQKRFITDAGHELKTPLAAISVNADVLELEVGKNLQVDKIRRQTGKLDDLIQEMLTLAKMEDFSEKKAEHVDINISMMLEEMITEFEPVATKGNKTITLKAKKGIIIKGVERDLSRLISVLMDNAVKYCTDNGKVTVVAKKVRNLLHIEISNTGDAIKEEELQHLFDRFYRTDASRSRDTGGYGIGLSIAKAIVDRYKGSINVKNINNEICFSIDMPIK